MRADDTVVGAAQHATAVGVDYLGDEFGSYGFVAGVGYVGEHPHHGLLLVGGYGAEVGAPLVVGRVAVARYVDRLAHVHQHLADYAAHGLPEAFVFGKSGIGKEGVAAVGDTHCHGVPFAVEQVGGDVDFKGDGAAHVGHRRGLGDGAVAVDGVAVDVDRHAYVDAVEEQGDAFAFVAAGYVQGFAIPHFAAPATLAGGGVEEGVKLVETVGYAYLLPLAVVVVGGAEAAVVDSDGRRHDLQFGEGACCLIALRVGEACDGDVGIANVGVDRDSKGGSHGALQEAYGVANLGDVVFLDLAEVLGKVNGGGGDGVAVVVVVGAQGAAAAYAVAGKGEHHAVDMVDAEQVGADGGAVAGSRGAFSLAVVDVEVHLAVDGGGAVFEQVGFAVDNLGEAPRGIAYVDSLAGR